MADDSIARIVIEEIARYTGPTGGWLDSPKAVSAAILLRLKARAAAERKYEALYAEEQLAYEREAASQPERPEMESVMNCDATYTLHCQLELGHNREGIPCSWELTDEQKQWFLDRCGDDVCAHSLVTKGCMPCLIRYAKRLGQTVNQLRAAAASEREAGRREGLEQAIQHLEDQITKWNNIKSSRYAWEVTLLAGQVAAIRALLPKEAKGGSDAT